ncbi:MAG: pentapeptide repeat-containing protein [Paracoccaceae bacterium]
MGFIIATLIVLAVIAAVVAQDFSVFSWAYWQEGDTGTSRSEVFRNVGLFFVAVIALGFGIWRAWTAHRQAEASQRQAEAATEQARIAQQGQITDRFTTAGEHLGSAQLPVRLGGIYALWRLIKDSPERDVISVIDILCAFVRHPPHEIGQGPDTGASEDGQASAETAETAETASSTTEIRPDVQTVLNLIGTKEAVYRALLPEGYRLDLTGANLTRANLAVANLTRANLAGANLMDANLRAAGLKAATLRGVNPTGADLRGADLTRANLMDANLTGAILRNANLTGAALIYADLTRANLTGADLMDAKFLAQDQLDSACINKGHIPPALPEGLKPPQKECGPTPLIR